MNTPSVFKSPAGETAVMSLYDDALQHWPIPFESLHIPTRHGDTFVIECGDAAAPPLVLLHGAGTNSAIWRSDVAAYGRDHHIFAIDLPGEAGKSAPNRPAWDGPAFTEWLEDLFDALALKQATLMGISQGSWTALKFSITHPARVARLVIMCPGGIVPDRMSFVLQTIPLSLMGRWGMKRLVRLIYGRQPIPEGVEEITAVVMQNFKPRLGVLPIFTDDELQRLTMPILLLGGGQDALRDVNKIADRMRQFVEDLTIVILPEAGHALLNTPPHILPFLAKTQTSTAVGERP